MTPVPPYLRQKDRGDGCLSRQGKPTTLKAEDFNTSFVGTYRCAPSSGARRHSHLQCKNPTSVESGTPPKFKRTRILLYTSFGLESSQYTQCMYCVYTVHIQCIYCAYTLYILCIYSSYTVSATLDDCTYGLRTAQTDCIYYVYNTVRALFFSEILWTFPKKLFWWRNFCLRHEWGKSCSYRRPSSPP